MSSSTDSSLCLSWSRLAGTSGEFRWLFSSLWSIISSLDFGLFQLPNLAFVCWPLLAIWTGPFLTCLGTVSSVLPVAAIMASQPCIRIGSLASSTQSGKVPGLLAGVWWGWQAQDWLTGWPRRRECLCLFPLEELKSGLESCWLAAWG